MLTQFICPDGEKINIDDCLKNGGCRYGQRCATRPFLRRICFDQREFTGKISPSAAGNGPRLIYLKGVKDYAVKPDSRAFAILGVTSHANLSIHSYTRDVLSEEKLSDDKMKGIADLLDEDEDRPGFYILDDYKTSGSYKVTKYLGLVWNDVPVLDENGDIIRYKSGKRKGEIKTIKKIEIDPAKVDILDVQLQLGRYRIFFENAG